MPQDRYGNPTTQSRGYVDPNKVIEVRMSDGRYREMTVREYERMLSEQQSRDRHLDRNRRPREYRPVESRYPDDYYHREPYYDDRQSRRPVDQGIPDPAIFDRSQPQAQSQRYDPKPQYYDSKPQQHEPRPHEEPQAVPPTNPKPVTTEAVKETDFTLYSEVLNGTVETIASAYSFRSGNLVSGECVVPKVYVGVSKTALDVIPGLLDKALITPNGLATIEIPLNVMSVVVDLFDKTIPDIDFASPDLLPTLLKELENRDILHDTLTVIKKLITSAESVMVGSLESVSIGYSVNFIYSRLSTLDMLLSELDGESSSVVVDNKTIASISELFKHKLTYVACEGIEMLYLLKGDYSVRSKEVL